ncbi:MAG: ABC transporter ATP-binding protein [Clostridiales bacterium]|nr:ABC transporter ATP-binding protein [Clostridiales bacterium]
MLVVNGVTKKYKKFVANDNLSFTIGDGEVGVLLGPNGAGKSTIIKSIAGLLKYQGSIEIDKYDNHSIEAKRKLGYIPEIPALYDTLTIDEHLEFIRRAYRVEDDSVKERLLDRFELTDKCKKMGKELSKGMQQKVSICCALMHDPSVVIFDEPMVGLDPHAIKELKLVFHELKEAGKTVLISTHMIDTIEDYWDVVHIMMNGRIAATKHNAHDPSEQKSLEQLFFEITEGISES